MIHFRPKDSDYLAYIDPRRIVWLSKSECGQYTLIHLDTKEVLESIDSMKTIEARIASALRPPDGEEG